MDCAATCNVEAMSLQVPIHPSTHRTETPMGDPQSPTRLAGTTSGDFANSDLYDLGEPKMVSQGAWGVGMHAPPNTKASPLDTENVSWMRLDLGNSAGNPNEAGPFEVGAGGSQEVGLGGDRYLLGVDGAWYNNIGTRYRRIEPTDGETKHTHKEAGLLELEDANIMGYIWALDMEGDTRSALGPQRLGLIQVLLPHVSLLARHAT